VYTGSGDIGSVRRTERGVEFFSADERAMFQTPEAGETGSARNLFTGPGFFQVDLGIFKNVNLTSRSQVQFRIEIFNVFDTVNFADPNILVTAGSFGTITDTRVPPRIVQLGLKWKF
jgi:hypothetical protein